MARNRFTLRGRKCRVSNRRYSFAIDGETRRANEHEQSVHQADTEETEEPHRTDGRARAQGVVRKETRGRRGISVQKQNPKGAGEKRGDTERRVVELSENTDAVRRRA